MYNSQSGYDSLVDVCVNSAVANLRTMTVDQLNDLLYNESRFDALIDSLPQVCLSFLLTHNCSLQSPWNSSLRDLTLQCLLNSASFHWLPCKIFTKQVTQPNRLSIENICEYKDFMGSKQRILRSLAQNDSEGSLWADKGRV